MMNLRPAKRLRYALAIILLLALAALCYSLWPARVPVSAIAFDAASDGSGATAAAIADRVQRVENGLRPPVIFTGQAAPRMTLVERMRYYKVPGVSLAVINHGTVEWARGYGYRDVASKTPVTVETLFQAASISKTVSAVGALRLVQAGQLSLDEDVNRKLTSWRVPDNEFTREQKVTLRRILSHTAGLTIHGFGG